MPLDIPLFRLDWAGKFHGGKMDPNLYWIVGEHSLDPSPVSFAYTVIIVGGAFLVEPPYVGLEAQPTIALWSVMLNPSDRRRNQEGRGL